MIEQLELKKTKDQQESVTAKKCKKKFFFHLHLYFTFDSYWLLTFFNYLFI